MPAGRQAVCLDDAGLSPCISIRKAVMRCCGGGWSRFEVSCDFTLHVPQIRGYLLRYMCLEHLAEGVWSQLNIGRHLIVGSQNEKC